MKVVDITTTAIAVKRPADVWSATHALGGRGDRRDGVRTCVLVEVHTDQGLVGLGEANSRPELAAATKAIIDHNLRPLIVGSDPRGVVGLWSRMYKANVAHGRRGVVMGAISGVDIALWDLAAKNAGLPLFRMLGAERSRVPVYASGGWYADDVGPDELKTEYAGYREQGFHSAKMKLGALSPRDDLERFDAAADGFASGSLGADANRAYDLKTAITMARELANRGAWFFEEPVSPDFVEHSTRVAQDTPLKVAGYETIHTRFGYRELLTRGAIDIAQPDAIWTGGITEFGRIASLASAFGVAVAAHSFGSPLSFVANLHAAAATPEESWVEKDMTPNPLHQHLLVQQIPVQGGYAVLDDSNPGLGVEVDRRFVEDHALRLGDP